MNRYEKIRIYVNSDKFCNNVFPGVVIFACIVRCFL